MAPKRAAVGTCRFCGHGVCENHIKARPYILQLYIGKNDVQKALVVEDALHCGACRPRDGPWSCPNSCKSEGEQPVCRQADRPEHHADGE